MSDPTPPPQTNTDPRFSYQKIVPKNLSVEQLDEMWSFVANSPKGYIGAIIAGLKLVLALAYLIAREKLLAAEMEADKQAYEQSQAGKNQSSIDNDNLGSEKKGGK